MPTTLPLVTSTRLNVPPQPSDPPSKQDVTRACRLKRDALVAHSYKQIGGEDVANVAIYEQQILSKAAEDEAAAVERVKTFVGEKVQNFVNSDAFTARLSDAIKPLIDESIANALKPMNNRLDKLDQGYGKLNETVASMNANMGQRLAKLERTAAITYNITCVAGTNMELRTVPFLDGTDPTVGETALPALKSYSDICNLPQAQLKRYYTGYLGRAPRARNMDELREDVADAVGCLARPYVD
ncbi:hypothetical protein H0H93_006854 [Arthromyces matolae]|nr:hypothetical protein H0H93_006854 [Arthromyces matolae]